ncbi:MAG: allophanate hydrolase [Xanthobacteraceae bacterium]
MTASHGGTIAEIVAAHRSDAATPETTIARCYARIRTYADPATFISLRAMEDALADARALRHASAATLPLYGVPVAIKDNIDVAGLPTTAACPAFSYQPAHDATCVARLKAAGAIIIGKTNLDQFATGLSGVRSPYGVPRNPLDPALIPGGSSSGSAVAVAAGLVPLALGTDTAGSGRVPAALCNIVGMKPSLGLVSTSGVVPACRTLDCVSVFARTVDDAFTALSAVAGHDAGDPYSRVHALGRVGTMPPHLRLGVPPSDQRVFLGDAAAAAAYEEALARLARLGSTLVEFDMQPFYEAAQLLYDGPWVAERYLAARAVLESAPQAMHPVTREIILGGTQLTAADTFAAFYRLEELRRLRDTTFAVVDALVLPTIPTVYTVKDVLADPIALNSRLGTYTNFANLLDLCALAVPAAVRSDGIPFGISLVAPAGRDAALAAMGSVFHSDTGLPLGATGDPQPPPRPVGNEAASGEIALAVVGAHLSGMPLNGELHAHGARFLAEALTAAEYRLFALAGSVPPKPGLLRVASGTGAPISLEIWAMSAASFGRFVAAVPPPLCIGTLTLADGRTVHGFLVEAHATINARDISAFGGWRAYMASTAR